MSSTKPVAVALIGAGRIGASHAEIVARRLKNATLALVQQSSWIAGFGCSVSYQQERVTNVRSLFAFITRSIVTLSKPMARAISATIFSCCG